MVFIETSVFTKRLADILSDEDYRALQTFLAQQPQAGDVIVGTGGLRKVRWAASGRGKRGGARVIYYHVTQDAQILLLLIYAKNEQDDLTPDQKRTLKLIVEKWNG